MRSYSTSPTATSVKRREWRSVRALRLVERAA
jgi:hypothetical protein